VRSRPTRHLWRGTETDPSIPASLEAQGSDDALRGGRLTLSTLFDIDVASPAHHAKKPRTQREDQRKLERVLAHLGDNRDVRTPSCSDIERYKQARLAGENSPRRKVKHRAVASDLVALLTMLNWATREREVEVNSSSTSLDAVDLKTPALSRNSNRYISE
jgi:hypothetical protein